MFAGSSCLYRSQVGIGLGSKEGNCIMAIDMLVTYYVLPLLWRTSPVCLHCRLDRMLPFCSESVRFADEESKKLWSFYRRETPE